MMIASPNLLSIEVCYLLRRSDGRHGDRRLKEDEDYRKEREKRKALEKKASEGRTDERDRDEKRKRRSEDDRRDRKFEKVNFLFMEFLVL